MATKSEIEDLFRKPIVRKFSVSINGEHHVKKKCSLAHLFLIIADPDGCTQTLYIYLPSWSIYVKHKHDHATLYLDEKVYERKNHIKVKSKKFDVIDAWNAKILHNLESVIDYEFSVAQYSVRGTVDGKAMHLKLHMSPTAITVSDKENNVYFESERGPSTQVLLAEDLTPRMKIMNDYSSIVLKFKEDAKLGAALILLNSKIPEVQAETLIAIDDTVVPELNISLSELMDIPQDDMKAIPTSQQLFNLESLPVPDDANNNNENNNNNNNEGLDGIDTSNIPIAGTKAKPQKKDSIIIDETDPDVIKQNLRRKYQNLIQKITITQNINPDEILEEIASQHQRPKLTSQPCDKYNVPDGPDKRPLFAMNDYIYKASKPLPHNTPINIRTDFNLEEIKTFLTSHNEIPKFMCPNNYTKYIDQTKKKIQNTDWSDRPYAATGIFLQGRKVPISDIQKHLDSIAFTVYEIQVIVRNNRIVDLNGILEMFNKLFKENLVYTFFSTLENAHQFKSIVYDCDALCNTPGFCTEAAILFDSPVQPVKMAPIPYMNDIVPHIRVASAVQRLKTYKHTETIEGQTDDQDSITSLDQIIFSLIYLIGDKSKTQAKDLWESLEKYDEFQSIKEDESILNDEQRVIACFLQMLSQNTISTFLVTKATELKMMDRVVELILTAAQLIDINRMILITEKGTILKKTTQHIMHLFSLFD